MTRITFGLPVPVGVAANARDKPPDKGPVSNSTMKSCSTIRFDRPSHQNFQNAFCLLECFTICLFISPDLDGYRNERTER